MLERSFNRRIAWIRNKLEQMKKAPSLGGSFRSLFRSGRGGGGFSPQDQERIDRCGCHSSMVAEERLVFSGSELVGRSSSASASTVKSNQESSRTFPPRPQILQLAACGLSGNSPSSRSF